MYACTPEEGTRSHIWLWAFMWLLGIELRISGRATRALNFWAISPALARVFKCLWGFFLLFCFLFFCFFFFWWVMFVLCSLVHYREPSCSVRVLPFKCRWQHHLVVTMKNAFRFECVLGGVGRLLGGVVGVAVQNGTADLVLLPPGETGCF